MVILSMPSVLAMLVVAGNTADEHFVCGGQIQRIPLSFVNDDYCDCEDGSDEPKTAACSNGQFLCLNTNYKSVSIFSSLVDDGVCDCCDGSDEYSGKVNCEDTCAILADAVMARKKVLFSTFNAGASFRNATVEQAQVGGQNYIFANANAVASRLGYSRKARRRRTTKRRLCITRRLLRSFTREWKSMHHWRRQGGKPTSPNGSRKYIPCSGLLISIPFSYKTLCSN
jgi:hypothetical protein